MGNKENTKKEENRPCTNCKRIGCYECINGCADIIAYNHDKYVEELEAEEQKELKK